MSLRFQCNSKCKQVYPFRELLNHTQRGLCYNGYVRQEEQQVGRGLGGSTYVGNQGGAGLGNRQSMMVANSKPLFDMSGYKDTRGPVTMIHFMQKDSKNVYQLDLKLKTVETIKVQPYNNSSFPHNFQCVQNPQSQ